MSKSTQSKPTSNQGNGGNWPTKNGSSNSSGSNLGNAKPK